MAWAAASNTIGTYNFYLQEDTGWVARPSIAKHTPIGAVGSVHQFVNAPSETRVITGYVVDAAAQGAIVALAMAGTAITFGSVDCYIMGVDGNRLPAENIAYLASVTLQLSRDRVVV
jgi:hypothetical protein